MDFGKIDDFENVDFKLPKDHPATTKVLKEAKKPKKPIVYVGCAKWGRKEWVGKVYPSKTKEKDFLKFYQEQFNCIELNATFYKMPDSVTMSHWKSMVKSDFKFFPKVTQLISHRKRLKDTTRLVDDFCSAALSLEENLGACFLQLNNNFTIKSYPQLERFLKEFPKEVPLFLELRNTKWFSPEFEESEKLFKVMEQENIGAIITDAAGRRDVVHMRLSTPKVFIRFVGNSLHPTDYTRIDDWVKRIKNWLKQGMQEVYFFIHQHDERYTPELCLYLIQQLNKECGLMLKEPKLFSEEQGLSEK